MIAVGVELAADVLTVARQRALDLGVSDRVAFHEGDACDYHDPTELPYVNLSGASFGFPFGTCNPGKPWLIAPYMVHLPL